MMEILQIIRESPDLIGLIVLLAWNYSLQKEVATLREQLARVSERTERTRDSLIEKLTKTDIKE